MPDSYGLSLDACLQGTVVGFDFGTKQIGVAIGETLIKNARPLTTIAEEQNTRRFAAIARIIEEWQPVLFVVGRPLHADGSEHDLTRRSDRFARQLHGRFHLPVVRADERYTSLLAEAQLRAAGFNRNKALIDAVAAQLILQTWFDRSGQDPESQ